jgi:hypothetical protein
MPRGARVKAKNDRIVNNMSNPTNHPPVTVVASDDWSFTGALVDTDGSPLDPYLITSSARSRIDCGTVSPSALAVLRFTATAFVLARRASHGRSVRMTDNI